MINENNISNQVLFFNLILAKVLFINKKTIKINNDGFIQQAP